MATELLSVPEEKVPEVIKVLRAGLEATTDKDVRYNIEKWCNEMEAFYKDLADGGS